MKRIFIILFFISIFYGGLFSQSDTNIFTNQNETNNILLDTKEILNMYASKKVYLDPKMKNEMRMLSKTLSTGECLSIYETNRLKYGVLLSFVNIVLPLDTFGIFSGIRGDKFGHYFLIINTTTSLLVGGLVWLFSLSGTDMTGRFAGIGIMIGGCTISYLFSIIRPIYFDFKCNKNLWEGLELDRKVKVSLLDFESLKLGCNISENKYSLGMDIVRVEF